MWRAHLTEQWKNPQDIFSLLLIIGGDTVHKAMAQLVGNSNRFPAPVPFSFGCVAYAYNSIMLAMGEGRIMPPTTDYASILINAENSITRTNNSWVLGRLLRDMEPERGSDVGLRVEVYEMDCPPKRWHLGSVWWTGFVTIPIQLAISLVPIFGHKDWTYFIITVAGTLLATGSSLLPQWRAEKWATRRLRRLKSKTVCITKGNGATYVLVIVSKEGDYDLEVLAAGRSYPSQFSKVFIMILALLWMVLLITATCTKDYSWYLIGIGLLGMSQNLYAAGAKRKPSEHGIPLQLKEQFAEAKTMDTLKSVECRFKGVGRCLLPTFFGEGLTQDERDFFAQPGEYPVLSISCSPARLC